MKIGILSDTHLTQNCNKIPTILQGYLKNVDLIIHCGDVTNRAIVEKLMEIAPVYGVLGNVDDESMPSIFQEKRVIEVGGYKIGLIHGHQGRRKTMENAMQAFLNENVDIILFGHSHQPILQTKKGTLFINPGSPTQKRRERMYSIVLLTIDNEAISCEFKFYSCLL